MKSSPGQHRFRLLSVPLAVLLGVAGLVWLVGETVRPHAVAPGAAAPHTRAAQALARAAGDQVRVQGVAGSGAGLLLDPVGDVLSGAWMLGQAATATLHRADGTQQAARLRGIDARTGLALLTADHAWPQTGMLDAVEPLRPGQRVYLLGSGGAVRAQVGSLRQTRVSLPGQAAVPVMTTDIRACPEDAGGVLADQAGRVIGVVLAAPQCGPAQILPLSAARHLAAELKANGRAVRGWIGAEAEDTAAGVVLRSVRANSPAAQAGLRAGDRLLNLDGVPLRQAAEFAPRIAESSPGHDAALTVLRDGHSLGVTVIVVAEPAR